MCNRLTKLSVTMWYTFFGIFDDTSLWILPKTHDPSLCDTPDEMFKNQKSLAAVADPVDDKGGYQIINLTVKSTVY